MRGVEIEFRIESQTANVSSWHARTQKTHKFLSRESVLAGLTRTDWLVSPTDYDYNPDFVYGDHDRFHATPAMPVDVRVRLQEVGAQMEESSDDNPQEHLLAYGHRELITPGSRFRALAWGNYPELDVGDIMLIGKERADAVITRFDEHEVEETTDPGMMHSIELLKIPRTGADSTEMEIFLDHGDLLRRTATTQRYGIVIGSTDEYLRIGEWHIPKVPGVTVE